jgi:hypothetical protein
LEAFAAAFQPGAPLFFYDWNEVLSLRGLSTLAIAFKIGGLFLKLKLNEVLGGPCTFVFVLFYPQRAGTPYAVLRVSPEVSRDPRPQPEGFKVPSVAA